MSHETVWPAEPRIRADRLAEPAGNRAVFKRGYERTRSALVREQFRVERLDEPCVHHSRCDAYRTEKFRSCKRLWNLVA